MAGGSADAAAALIGCSALWGVDIGRDELAALGARLGSDVPFALSGGTAVGTGRGVLRQHYETDALDASTLLAALFGFLPHDDERLRATVLAIRDELSEHGYVLRYKTDETDDGLSGKEGTFLICSFWLVSALAIVGEVQAARDLMERLLGIASPLGLYAEEFDADTGRHLGNFPQAFSHLALIEAAARIIVHEQLEERT
jgi:GH15 family glucan-1,4-alpha-glucosidase